MLPSKTLDDLQSISITHIYPRCSNSSSQNCEFNLKREYYNHLENVIGSWCISIQLIKVRKKLSISWFLFYFPNQASPNKIIIAKIDQSLLDIDYYSKILLETFPSFKHYLSFSLTRSSGPSRFMTYDFFYGT